MSFPFFLIPIVTAPKRLVSIKRPISLPTFTAIKQGILVNKNREQALEGP
jgi:hypothetical protein